MASVTSDARGNRTVQFSGMDGKRRSLRLGKVTSKQADTVKDRVAALVQSRRSNTELAGHVSDWLRELPADLFKHLIAAGLVQARPRVDEQTVPTLEAFIDTYIASKVDVKTGTQTNFKISKARLVKFFGADKPIDAIKASDAADCAAWLKKNYALATAGKTVKHARQFLAYAVDKELLLKNPFAKVKAGGQKNDKRLFMVSAEVAEKVIAACPDSEWRLIFALSRYGGLRCPSEHLALTWPDVDWENDRFLVRSPKKEDERWVPIFPELRAHLEDARTLAPPGAVHLIKRYRSPTQNLRTQLLRILSRAGIKPWPRLFQNLRSSRETELAKVYPLRDVCAWIGNSPKVAAEHYLQATEETFQEAVRYGVRRAAVSGALQGKNALQKPVRQVAASSGTRPLRSKSAWENPGTLQSGAAYCDIMHLNCMTPTGFEQPHKSQDKLQVDPSGAAVSGALDKPSEASDHLARLINRWEELPDHIKDAISILVSD